jgi:hypothetical protein
MGEAIDETKMPRKPTAIVQYKLRIRETLRRRIVEEAKKHGISANQEMVSRLEQSFEQEAVRKLDLIVAELDSLLKHATFVATAPKGHPAPEQGVDVSKFKESFVARQRVSNERLEFTAANQAAMPSMSPPELAMVDAKRVTPDILDLLADGDLNNLENRKFVRAFVDTLPASERGALAWKTGGLSAEGLNRVRNAILAKAYGDPDIIARVTESTDDDVKSVSNGLVQAAPAWAQLQADIDAGRVPEEFDLTPELMEAVKRTADMRAKGMKLEEYFAQQDAFDQVTDEVDVIIRAFYDPRTKRARSAAHIVDFLCFYAREAARLSTEAEPGAGRPKITPHDVLVALRQRRTRLEADLGRGMPKVTPHDVPAVERSQREKKKNRKRANQ